LCLWSNRPLSTHIPSLPRGQTLAGLSLRDLEYAAAVDRLRHFGRAAAACHVSQAALSEQVRKLEDLLGVRLFERGNRRVEPTAQGAALLRQIERVLTEAHGVLDLARSAGSLDGVLRLGAIATLGPYYLPHLLRLVRGGFPGLALHLAEGQTDGLLELLRRGELDVVLMALPAPGDGLVAQALFFEPFRLVCPADHPLALLAAPGLADLPGDDLILLEEGHCLRDQALDLCTGAIGRRRQATSIETLWHMIAAGEGVSLLPALSTSGRGEIAALMAVRTLTDADAGRTVALVWRRTDPRGGHFDALAAAMRAGLPAGVLATSKSESVARPPAASAGPGHADCPDPR
jgi:LysR family hydrogen peroxide-inducible transcriptional activator